MNEFLTFLNQWNLYELIIIIVAVLLTQALKIPLIKAGKKYEAKTGKDKSVITCWISIIPFVICFIGAFILNLSRVDWVAGVVDWAIIGTSAFALGSAAVAAFEIIKKFVQGFGSKKTGTEVLPEPGESQAEETPSTSNDHPSNQ